MISENMIVDLAILAFALGLGVCIGLFLDAMFNGEFRGMWG